MGAISVPCLGPALPGNNFVPPRTPPRYQSRGRIPPRAPETGSANPLAARPTPVADRVFLSFRTSDPEHPKSSVGPAHPGRPFGSGLLRSASCFLPCRKYSCLTSVCWTMAYTSTLLPPANSRASLPQKLLDLLPRQWFYVPHAHLHPAAECPSPTVALSLHFQDNLVLEMNSLSGSSFEEPLPDAELSTIYAAGSMGTNL